MMGVVLELEEALEALPEPCGKTIGSQASKT